MPPEKNPETKRGRAVRRIALGLVVLVIAGGVAAWVAGGRLIAPRNQIVGNPPEDFPATSFTLQSESGSTIQGWHLAAENSDGVLVLLHPIGGSRMAMLGAGSAAETAWLFSRDDRPPGSRRKSRGRNHSGSSGKARHSCGGRVRQKKSSRRADRCHRRFSGRSISAARLAAGHRRSNPGIGLPRHPASCPQPRGRSPGSTRHDSRTAAACAASASPRDFRN